MTGFYNSIKQDETFYHTKKLKLHDKPFNRGYGLGIIIPLFLTSDFNKTAT